VELKTSPSKMGVHVVPALVLSGQLRGGGELVSDRSRTLFGSGL
jgi:hypothetical protein